jgi:hypothetical protein
MARRSSSKTRALALLFTMLHGCDSCAPKSERTWALCTCDYVTDMDHPGKISFEVCGEPSRQSDVAKSCALTSGVGAVLECACRASSGGTCRDLETCRDVGR